MEKHFVTFYSPRCFIAEYTERAIDGWYPIEALKMLKDIKEKYDAKPCCFQFITKLYNDNEPDKIIAVSGTYFINGKLFTLEELIIKNDPRDKILIANMKTNNWLGVARSIEPYAWAHEWKFCDYFVWTEEYIK